MDKEGMFKKFSHIYCEKEALNYNLTKRIFQTLSSAQIVMINHYKDVFNRPRQNYNFQKKSQKIILAVKKDHFLYEGSDLCHTLDNHRFFYTAPVVNCIYNCEYCYLLGTYNSANIIVFVNTEDFLLATQEKLAHGALYLPISYDTDLLVMEKILGLCQSWISFSRHLETLFIEIRTKSSAYDLIKDIPVSKNVLLSWTLSPDSAINLFEHETPSFEQRLNAAYNAINDGWNVRICIDPILFYDNWLKSYTEMIDKLFDKVPANLLFDLVIGSFRVPSTTLKRMQHANARSSLIHYPFKTENYVSSYPESIENLLVQSVKEKILQYLPLEKIKII